VKAALLVMLGGCSLTFNFANTHYQCGPNGECPNGQSCVQDVCVAGSSMGDAGDDDAMPDGSGPALRCGTLYTIHDSFDAASPLWYDWTDGGPSATLASGDLVVSVPSGSADLWAGYGSQFLYDFTSSSLEVQLDQAAATTTVVEVRGANNEKDQIMVDSGMLVATVLNTGNAGTKAQTPYDPAVHKWLRLREDAGQTYFEWSTDGTTWTELTHIPNAFSPLDVRIELAAGGEQAQASTAKFGAVNTNAPVAAACPTDTFVEDFAAPAPAFQTWTDNGTTATLTGGQVVITTDGVADHYAGVEATHIFDLEGHSVYLDMPPAVQASPFITFAQIAMPNDTSSEAVFQVEGNTLFMLERVNNQTVSTTMLSYDASPQRYWRYRASGGQIFFDTSPDATTWTQQGAAPAMFDTTRVSILAGAGEYGTTPTHSAAFAGFNTP